MLPFVIRVTGPESSGKSTLARALAWALDGRYVAEAARDYLGRRGGRYVAADLPLILDAQLRAEDAARATPAGFVVCDTGPEVIDVWARVKYDHSPPRVRRAVAERSYDLTLLCAPDLPWQPDPLREHPDPAARAALWQRYRTTLAGTAGSLVEISGGGRAEQALRAVFAALAT